MVALQRAVALGTDINTIPKASENFSSSFASPSRDIWINSLWLASLALTLSVALVAGLVQQWLSYYVADITGHTPKKQACTRHYRFTGLNLWNVPAIIELLPVLMNTSLFLFFLGLVLFTQELSGMTIVMWFLVALMVVLIFVYAGMSFIPIWNAQCPYKTSLSKVYAAALSFIYVLAGYMEEQLKISPRGLEQREVSPRMMVRHLRRLKGRMESAFKSCFKAPMHKVSEKVGTHTTDMCRHG